MRCLDVCGGFADNLVSSSHLAFANSHCNTEIALLRSVPCVSHRSRPCSATERDYKCMHFQFHCLALREFLVIIL